MEKRKPHCKLSIVKNLVSQGRIRVTKSAVMGAIEMGFEPAEIWTVVQDLTVADFYKSMTTYADHRIWQDVYRPHTRLGFVYLKITVIDDVLVVSFKEL